MARRRKLGRALTGFGEGASDILGMLLQNKMITERQEKLRDIIGEQQRVSEEATTKRSLLGKALDDPEQARRLSRSGLLGDLDISGLFRTEAEQEAPVRRAIGEATDLAKLRTPEDVVSLRAAEGPIETLPGLTGLLQQRGAKEQALLGELPSVSEEGVDTQTGLKTRTTSSGAARRRELAAGQIVTPLEPTPQQAGANDLAQFTAGKGSELFQQLDARGEGMKEDVKMTPGRVKARVGEAGQTAAAEAPFKNQSTRQINTVNAAGDPVTQIVDAQTGALMAEFPRAESLPAQAQDRIAGADATLHSLGKLEKMFVRPEIQGSLGPVSGRVTGLGTVFPSAARAAGSYVEGFEEFKAETATLKNSIIKAITGAQMSEPEAQRIMGQIPLEIDPPKLWQAKARATRDNLSFLRNRILAISKAGTSFSGTTPADGGANALLDELLKDEGR